MKTITNVAPNGITYIDEEGNQQFIDFKNCQENNVEWLRNYRTRWTDEDEEFYQEAKYVGVRFALSEPPAVVFYTVPPTRFEFPTRERLYEVLVGIKKAGWRTNDGE